MLAATTFVMILPGLAVWAFAPMGSWLVLLVSVPLAMGLSIAAASIGSAIWKRRPGSRDLVFADLLLWGYLRRLRAERRLADARRVLALESAREHAGVVDASDRRVEALERLSSMLEARDAYTHGHTRRVTGHAERIARALRLSPAEVAKVRTAAALHDVGKVNVPREILNKPGRLTHEELAVIRRHPEDGADMLAGIGDAEITAMVRHHHERLDGGGYPDGLAGDAIPLGARIIAVADTFDAMTSSRAYRNPCSHGDALEVLSTEAGAQLDAAAVSAFLSYYTGRKSVAWTTLVTTAPTRFAAWLESTSGALVHAAPTVGVAALLAAVPAAAGFSSAASHRERPGGAPRKTVTSRLGASVAGSGEMTAGTSSHSPRRVSGLGPSHRAASKAPGSRDRSRRGESSVPGGTRSGSDTANSTPGTAESHDPQAPGHEPSSGGPQGSQGAAGSPGTSQGPPANPAPLLPAPLDGLLPHVDIPDVHLPVEPPTVQAPKVEVPTVDVPKVDVPKVEVPPVHLP